jgi:hypothetical protein
MKTGKRIEKQKEVLYNKCDLLVFEEKKKLEQMIDDFFVALSFKYLTEIHLRFMRLISFYFLIIFMFHLAIFIHSRHLYHFYV